MVCGISPYVREIAERTAGRGDYDVHVLTSDDGAVDMGLARGYAVHPRVKRWGPQWAGQIVREILRLEPGVVHIQNPTIKYAGWRSVTMSVVGPRLKRKAADVRLVVMQHDIAVGRPGFRWRYRPLFRAAARERLGVPEKAVCAAYFGFVLPGRNVDVLLGALVRLRDEGQAVRGIILGGAHPEDPGYFDECRQLAEQLGLGEVVTWTGFASEEQVGEGLAAADVFVSLPERGADLRNTSILTAVRAEVPIVTTVNERHYRDADLDRLGCVYVDGRDAGSVARGIMQQVERPPGREELAAQAAALEPEKVWQGHIEMNVRAYQGASPTHG